MFRHTVAAALLATVLLGCSGTRAALARRGLGEGGPQPPGPGPRSGALAGRVTHDDGTAPARAEVEALALRARRGQALVAAASGTTDERGEFRLDGLPAGQYLIVARAAAPGDEGHAPGPLRHAPTYYPGVLSSGEAQPVAVPAGRDAPRVEFRLRMIRPARISGIMTSPEQRPLLGGSAILVPRGPGSGSPLPADAGELRPDGRFFFRNVPPGRYQIRARVEFDPKEPPSVGSFAITVDGEDIDNVVLPLARGAIVQGRIEWERSARAQRPTLQGLRVRAPFADGSSFGDSPGGDVLADGTFRIPGVMPGSHYLAVEGLVAPWTLAGVSLRGRDLFDRRIDIHEDQQLHDLRLVLSRSTPELRGTVTNAAGRPAPDVLVVTTPSSPLHAFPANPRVKMTRSDGEGRYRIGGLAAGGYRVLAVDGLDELIAERPEWLRRLNGSGTPITLAAAGSHALDLAVVDSSALEPAPAR